MLLYQCIMTMEAIEIKLMYGANMLHQNFQVFVHVSISYNFDLYLLPKSGFKNGFYIRKHNFGMFKKYQQQLNIYEKLFQVAPSLRVPITQTRRFIETPKKRYLPLLLFVIRSKWDLTNFSFKKVSQNRRKHVPQPSNSVMWILYLVLIVF